MCTAQEVTSAAGLYTASYYIYDALAVLWYDGIYGATKIICTHSHNFAPPIYSACLPNALYALKSLKKTNIKPGGRLLCAIPPILLMCSAEGLMTDCTLTSMT